MAGRLSDLHSSRPAGLNPTEIFLILVSVRSRVEYKAAVRLKELGKLKK
jgi:hypothetical protein